MTLKYEPMGGIVGGHTNGDSIPQDNPDLKALHLSAKLCRDSNSIFKGDDIIPPAPCFRDFTFKFCKIFFGQNEYT